MSVLKVPSPPPMLLAILVATLLLLTRAAAAQREPALGELHDLTFLPETPLADGFGHALTADLSVRGDLGPNLPTAGAAELSLRDRLAYEPTPYRWIRFDALLGLPVSLDRATDTFSTDLSELAGRHHVWGRLGFGQAWSGSTGVDLALDYRLDHGPDDRLRPDATIGGHDFAEHDLRVSVEPRRGLDSGLAWAMPFEYGLVLRDYQEAAVPDALTHVVSSGFGIRQYAVRGDGWGEVIGLSWSRTRFGALGDEDREFAAPLADDLSRLQLRLLHADGLAIAIEDGTISGSLGFGASWLWNDDGTRTATIFEGSYGVEGRVDDEVRSIGGGIAVSRSADWTPGGGRLLARHSLDIDFFYENHAAGLGLSHRQGWGWLAQPDPEFGGVSNGIDAVPRHTLFTEWFLQLSALQLGVYHRADYAPLPNQLAVDPLDAVRGWEHEAGIFVRLADLL